MTNREVEKKEVRSTKDIDFEKLARLATRIQQFTEKEQPTHDIKRGVEERSST